MGVPFVGEGHHALVDALVGEFETVCTRRVPSWWSLEANTGWGKTRVIQEFYARIAGVQPEPRYWPPAILTPEENRVNVQRKRVHPLLTKAAVGAMPSWFWWGISCSSRHGTPLNALVHDLERFEERRDALELRFRELSSLSTRLKEAFEERKGEVAEAAIGDAVSAAASVASIAVPGLGLLVLLGKWGVGRVKDDRRRGRDERAADVGEQGPPDVVGELAPALERFASAGIPLVIVVEDVHEADDALVELLARVMAATSAPMFVLTTSWRGMIDESHRPVHGLLDRVDSNRVRRVLCEREVAELSRADLGAIVDVLLPGVDRQSRDRLAARYPNPYAIQLACQTRLVQRAATTGTISEEVVAKLPRDVDDLFRRLWEELPEPLRRVLVIAGQLAPGSISAQFGFGDLRWDPALLGAVVERVEWAAEDLPDLKRNIRDATETYAWVRTVDDSLQRFHDPIQHEIAADEFRRDYGDDEQHQVHVASAAAANANAISADREVVAGGERATNRDRLLVALAAEDCAAWNGHAASAAIRTCEALLQLKGSAELSIAIEICTRALADPVALGSEEAAQLRGIRATGLGESGVVRRAIEEFLALLDDLTRVLGPDAPGTLTTRNNLASWLGQDATAAPLRTIQLLTGRRPGKATTGGP